MSIANFLDDSPTVYLVTLALIMRWIGSYMNQRFPRVAFFQFSFGIVIFASLAVRRLVVNPPYDGLEVIVALIHAGSLGMIAFGVTGGIGTMVLLSKDGLDSLRIRMMHQQTQYDEKQRARQKAQERADAVANGPSSEEREQLRQGELAHDKLRRQAEEAEEKRLKAQQEHRRTLRLQTELKSQSIPDTKRRKTVRDMIDLYFENEIPTDEFNRRLQIIQEHIGCETVEKPTGFQSLTEIDSEFSNQLLEIAALNTNDVEKASLRAYINKEKQAAIHDFLKKET